MKAIDKDTNSLKRENIIFWAGVLIFGVLRVWITSSLPLYAIPTAAQDDGLMYGMAKGFAAGEWMGELGPYTLSKGVFFPIFSGLLMRFHIPFLPAQSILYVISCVFFIIAISKITSNKYILLLSYLILIFNPYTYSMSCFQRLYRGGLSISLTLIFFGSVLGIYFRIKESTRKWIFYLITLVFSFPALIHTRDDSIYIYPFLAVAMIFLIITIFREKKEMWRIVLLMIPVITLVLSNVYVAGNNERYYGKRMLYEGSGAYGEAIKAMYSVKYGENIPYVSVPREKLEKIYECSPTLKSIRPILDKCCEGWDYFGWYGIDGEVEDGFFTWCVRMAVGEAGYYSDANTSEDFYKKVADEINAAISDGRLEKRSTMPSPLMSPWNDGYLGELVKATLKSLWATSIFKDTYIALTDRKIPEAPAELLKEVEDKTGSYVIYDEKPIDDEYLRKLNSAEKERKILDIVSSIYRIIVPILFLGLFVSFIIRLLKKQKEILASLGLFLSLILFLIGIAYTHISAFDSIKSLYLGPASVLLLGFVIVEMIYLLQDKSF